MGWAIALVVVIVVVIPVVVLMSGAVVAVLLGWSLRTEGEHDANQELVDLS